MLKWLLVLPAIALCLASAMAAPQDDQYVPGPDSKARDGVPRDQVAPMPSFHSTIYADTTIVVSYVPAQERPGVNVL